MNSIKDKLQKEILIALDNILEKGYGRIEIIIDKERGVFDVIPSPRIRIGKGNHTNGK